VTDELPGYEDLVEIARHDDSVVFRAWQPAFSRGVAVHLLPGTSLDELKTDVRRTAALADHPNVVTVHELGVTDAGVPYLVTELLERKATLDWYEAVRVTITVAGVLDAARGAGVGELTVEPEDVSFSRFGEPKVSLFGRGPAAREVDILRSLLRELPAGDSVHPAAVRAALDGPVDDDAGLVRLLQRAQHDAGRPVTDLPAGPSPAAAPADRDTEGLSAALTVVPASAYRRSHRRTAVGAAALVMVGVLSVMATTAAQHDRTPTSTTTASPALTTTAAIVGGRPLDPPLHVADFASERWTAGDNSRAQTTLVDGRLTIRVNPRSARTFPVWEPPPDHNRLSVTVAADVTPDISAELGIVCGQPGAGSKFIRAFLGSSGSWVIETSDGLVARGSAAERQRDLRDPFAMRLDCVTDSSPPRAALFLNDRRLGEVSGRDAFPLDGVHIAARTTGIEAFEVSIGDIAVRRLG